MLCSHFLYKYQMAEAVSSIKPGERANGLVASRQAKMAQSAHAYVRGNTLRFDEWLKKHSSRAVPEGPPIWICGIGEEFESFCCGTAAGQRSERPGARWTSTDG